MEFKHRFPLPLQRNLVLYVIASHIYRWFECHIHTKIDKEAGKSANSAWIQDFSQITLPASQPFP